MDASAGQWFFFPCTFAALSHHTLPQFPLSLIIFMSLMNCTDSVYMHHWNKLASLFIIHLCMCTFVQISQKNKSYFKLDMWARKWGKNKQTKTPQPQNTRHTPLFYRFVLNLNTVLEKLVNVAPSICTLPSTSSGNDQYSWSRTRLCSSKLLLLETGWNASSFLGSSWDDRLSMSSVHRDP